MWLEITETTWKPSHAVLEILTSEYMKQKQVFVKDVISNGPGRVTHTLNIDKGKNLNLVLRYIYIYNRL